MTQCMYNILVGSILLSSAPLLTLTTNAALTGDIVINGSSTTAVSGTDFTITPNNLNISLAAEDFSPLLSGATVTVSPLVLTPVGLNYKLADNVVFTFEKNNTTLLTYTVAAGVSFNRIVVGDNTTGITTVFQSSQVVPGVFAGGQDANSFLLATRFVTEFSDTGTFYANIHATAVPEPSTLLAGSFLMLPLGISVFKVLRKKELV